MSGVGRIRDARMMNDLRALMVNTFHNPPRAPAPDIRNDPDVTTWQTTTEVI